MIFTEIMLSHLTDACIPSLSLHQKIVQLRPDGDHIFPQTGRTAHLLLPAQSVLLPLCRKVKTVTERQHKPPPPTFRRQNLIEDRPHLRAGRRPLPGLCESGDDRFVVLHCAQYLQNMGRFKSQYLSCLLKDLSLVLQFL